MGQTWYDNGGIPREEHGGKPQATLEDIQTATQGVQNYFERERKERDAFYEQQRAKAITSGEIYEDRLSAINRSKERALEEAEEQTRRYLQEEKENEERKQHREAVTAARKRYESKSFLYRLFHKKLSITRAKSMTTDDINNLYGGMKEEKGRSR